MKQKEYNCINSFVDDVLKKLNALKELENKGGTVVVMGRYIFIRDVLELLVKKGYHISFIFDLEDGSISQYCDEYALSIGGFDNKISIEKAFNTDSGMYYCVIEDVSFIYENCTEELFSKCEDNEYVFKINIINGDYDKNE